VLFLGTVAQTSMPAVYSAADLLLAPSPLEAFGFVYLEAMACGCPPIGCTTGGAAEVVADGVTGLLIAPHDSQSLADHTLTLLDDGPRRARFAAAGRDLVRRQFSLPTMVRRTEQFYVSLTCGEAAA
jgi:glycosyltransferase involved in cell wall biosynthesis